MLCVFIGSFVSSTSIFIFKQKTAYEIRISDWSSDVCSSDLISLGVAMLAFFAVVQIPLGLFTVTVSHIAFTIPFVAVVVRSRMAGFDESLEEASRDLGANGWQTFWSVTFPYMIPGVVAGALLAFTLSLDAFVITFFTSGPGTTTSRSEERRVGKDGVSPCRSRWPP